MGLLIVLASLEIIRSVSVNGFFSSFFSQFGVGSGASSSAPATNVLGGGLPPSGSSTANKVKGMPGNQ